MVADVIGYRYFGADRQVGQNKERREVPPTLRERATVESFLTIFFFKELGKLREISIYAN